VRAIIFDYADPAFPASFVEIPEPDLPGDDWVRLTVDIGGICGSDLHLFDGHSMGPGSPLAPLSAFPFLLGHEVAGRVIDAGDACDIPIGTRVAIDPGIPCAARGIDPPCPKCAAGNPASCEMFGSRVATPGTAIGFTTGLGGGWSEQVLAHASMVHVIPDGVPARGAALHEPLSIAIHGLLHHPPTDGDPVLVVGAGIIGLATVAACRGLFPQSEVSVVARYAHQGAAALACGATNVVQSAPELAHLEELAPITGARLSGAHAAERMLIGGFPYVVDAAGTGPSVTESLRVVDNHGTVLLLGAAGYVEVDLTPVWWKECALATSRICITATPATPSIGRSSCSRTARSRPT
jgi:L-iditol 2-dehydrogenase